MEAYLDYIRGLLRQGVDPRTIVADLRQRNLDDNTIIQLMKTATGSSSTVFDPIVEAYTDYVKMQASRGMDQVAIRMDLQARGLAPQVITQLLQVSTQAHPASYPQAMQRFSSDESLAGQSAIVSNKPHRMTKSYLGWLLIALGCAVPSIVIALDAPGRFAGNAQTLLTVGDITGVVGMCLYVFDLVLAMRLSWLEDIFGGLNKVYIAHAVLGSTALMFILVHPVLLSLRLLPYGLRTVGSFFIPSLHYIGTAFGIVATFCMLALVFITLYAHLPYKIWLKTHKYLGAVYLLICVHVLFTPNSITQNLFMHTYLYLLVGIGLLAFVYRTLLPSIFIRRYIYIIKEVTMKTTGVVEVTMMPTQKQMPYVAGQFIFISFHADGISSEWHPFTIASPPSDGTVSIAVKSLGAYTETMNRLLPHMVGMSVGIEGAYGRFSYRNFKNANQVWVAGGIGVTPFLSMAQSLGDGAYNIDLYYSVKSEAELFDVDVLARAQSNVPGKVFRVFPFVTDKYGRHLSADLIAANSGDIAQKDFLICGPPPMMRSLEKQLLDLGVKKYQVHSEEFSIT